ncbi:SDR family NAD(P)-dependent oxidoreductase [Bradyrhizobium sp. 1(2017)]|uniref:SDR family NAD(P)-dependent oxidoreductase n=1 Tax=Bradyrhizobium sp. 1(2017) TaxID=1404888 RepID=UPI00140ED075|nr:SDR family NAD(P)-dependent oxidoreductase [Bradyrhizobium sp. 1(2017)]QIO36908.1 SDR family NAD(P)-dependent oxidoreductase [Bradyrhizobium sp. 1(2017)]
MARAILITGTSTGAGRVIAEALAFAGHRIFASMRDPNFKNREQANALWSRGIDVVPLDVTEDWSVDRAVDMVLKKAGRIDVLVNNVHIFPTGVTEAFTSAQAKAVFDINVVGLLRVTRAVLPEMRRQGDGLIVNIGSIFGRVTIPFLGIYGSTQFAIEALSDSLHAELAPLGVEVVLVQRATCPAARKQATSRESVERMAAYGAAEDEPYGRLPDLFARHQPAASSEIEDVPSALVQLVAMPKWCRPTRSVVGASLGADLINATAASVQMRILDDLGLKAGAICDLPDARPSNEGAARAPPD